MANLQTLDLGFNRFTELNLARATFESLESCRSDEFITGEGFCVDSPEITSLTLDAAMLSRGSFDAIVRGTSSITDASLVGLTFSDENPADIDNLIGIITLDNVTVSQTLFDLYADEFNAFGAMAGNTVSVVADPCDINGDGTCDVMDIDAMTQNVINGVSTLDDHADLIKRQLTVGFNTYYGDANLDGEFNSSDMVDVFIAGKYETGETASWGEGDWDANGLFTTSDMVVAFTDGGYELGPRVCRECSTGASIVCDAGGWPDWNRGPPATHRSMRSPA